jgi:hypothetical protein
MSQLIFGGLSGKESEWLRPPPHRTVRTTSTVHGSSKSHCIPCISSFSNLRDLPDA